MALKLMPFVMLGALCFVAEAKAGSVVSLSGNTQSTVCSTYSSVDVGTGGDVTIRDCSLGPSQNATFAVTPSVSQVTSGGTVSFQVSRQGSNLGNDNVTLNLSGTGVTSTPAALTVAFTTAEASTTKSAGSVILSGSGTASAVLSGAGTNTFGRTTIAVGGSCTSPVGLSISLGTLATSRTMPSGPYIVPPTSATVGGVAAASFTVPATGPFPGLWRFSFEATATAVNDAKEVSISDTCPGDFSTYVTGCHQINSNGLDGMYIAPSAGTGTGCILSPGKSYYFNIKARTPAVETGFMMNVTPLTL